MELPVSMLCDRKSTNVAGAQPGFIGYVTMPLFSTMSAFVPGLASENGALANMRSNLDTWKSYVETEEDKKVYEIKE
jgi:cAMP-specific phosphodiesterase 4/calcium/calmodulin-dependent 3',5'-cyclic nucleotide phosphodiesterase